MHLQSYSMIWRSTSKSCHVFCHDFRIPNTQTNAEQENVGFKDKVIEPSESKVKRRSAKRGFGSYLKICQRTAASSVGSIQPRHTTAAIKGRLWLRLSLLSFHWGRPPLDVVVKNRCSGNCQRSSKGIIGHFEFHVHGWTRELQDGSQWQKSKQRIKGNSAAVAEALADRRGHVFFVILENLDKPQMYWVKDVWWILYQHFISVK